MYQKLFIVGTLVMALGLSACGRRGDPIHPPTNGVPFPGHYPKNEG